MARYKNSIIEAYIKAGERWNVGTDVNLEGAFVNTLFGWVLTIDCWIISRFFSSCPAVVAALSKAMFSRALGSRFESQRGMDFSDKLFFMLPPLE